MRRVLVTGALVTAVALSGASRASAQDRKGGWFSIGAGWGSSNISCKECDTSEREGSGVGVFRGGWNLNPRTRIGVEYDLWTKSEAVETGVTGTVNLSNIVGTIAYYPAPTIPLYVKGGAGVALIDTEFKAENTSVSTDMGKGLGLIVGAGYDIRLGRNWSLTPAVDYWYGQIGDLKFAGETLFTDWKQNVVDFTVSVTFR